MTLRQAAIYGYRPENSSPCACVRRVRRRARERFLTTGEARPLIGAALAAREAAAPVPAPAIRPLLLTGCRQGEAGGFTRTTIVQAICTRATERQATFSFRGQSGPSSATRFLT